MNSLVLVNMRTASVSLEFERDGVRSERDQENRHEWRWGMSTLTSFKAIDEFVGVVEPKQVSTDSGSDDLENPQFQLHSGFKEIPTRLYSPDWPERNANIKIGRNLDGGIVELDRKERLKGYSEKLRDCALKLSLNEGKAIHGQVIKNGIHPDMHLWVSLINFYAKCHVLNFACQVLDEMPEQDVVSWTALISGFVADGYGSDGIYLFSVMRNEGIRPNEFSLATCLKACSICLDLEFGKQVHAEVIKLGFFSDIYVGSALVDLYAKCGEMEYADKVFFCMPKQNDVSWNALLNGYAQMGDEEKVFKMFCGIKSKMKYSKFTLSTVLKGFANSRNLGAGRVVHSMAIKIGCELDEFVSCTLVDMYSKCELADDALKVFMRIKNPDKVAWTAMITCFDQQGQKGEAAKLFRLMRKTGLRPNQFTLASIVSSAIDFSPHYGESIHACVYKYGFESENLVCNALITMYMKIESVDDGYRVFDAMSNRDVVSWNALLSGFHDNETFDQGPSIFNQMLVEGFKPNMYTFISILRSCSSLWNVSFGKQVHAHIIKESLDENSFIGTALIDMYAKCKCLGDAEAVFNRSNEKDLFTWTVMISGYAQTDQGEKAIQCFNQMQKEGVKPNEFTLASCLRGCAGIASLENGRLLHSLAIKSGHFGDIFVASALVDMYGKCGSIEDSETFFKGLDFRDTVAWNTIICGYSQHGQADKALEAFKFMLDEGVVPDGVTFLGILSACSHMGLTEEGKKHFTSMSELYGIIPLIEHYACMVDILGRAGKFNEVESFIAQMKLTPNALIWETVLGACKIHGNEEFGERAAEKLFELEPETDSNYILLSNIFAAKGRWGDVSKVRAFMSSRGVKKEPGCSWVEGNAQIHIFLSQDGSHPKILEIYQKLEDLGQKLASIGYIPNTDYVLHNVTNREKRGNLFHHSERLALAFALISNTPNKTIRIFKNLRICGDCHDFMKLVSHITNREIVIRDVKRFHHFRNGTCSCQDYCPVSETEFNFPVNAAAFVDSFANYTCYVRCSASNVEQCIKYVYIRYQSGCRNNMIWLLTNVSKGSCVIVASPELSGLF
ncbi:hypothetical protein TEA_017545 [Camellia sinensis var. sinensis]|uniref:DYW domain-containing protein n=1 Tax=Camellia sinensis var. sinensis TaxID=542762 RepID=A0A4S4DBR3_CAMSN|nr:hypothetical protein TEA_017545 [Camellia sinensis var. sinensis]